MAWGKSWTRMLCYMDHRLQGSPTFLACKLDAREDLQTKNSIRVRWVSDGQYQCILLCTSMCFYVLLFSNAVDNKALPWCHLFSGFSGFSGFRASRTGRLALGPSRYSWRSAIMSSCTKIRIGSEHWSSVRSKDKCNICWTMLNSLIEWWSSSCCQPRFSK